MIIRYCFCLIGGVIGIGATLGNDAGAVAHREVDVQRVAHQVKVGLEVLEGVLVRRLEGGARSVLSVQDVKMAVVATFSPSKE